MNETWRFSRFERAPASKTVSNAILKDISRGRLRMGSPAE